MTKTPVNRDRETYPNPEAPAALEAHFIRGELIEGELIEVSGEPAGWSIQAPLVGAAVRGAGARVDPPVEPSLVGAPIRVPVQG
jgi:hypothetical protein